MQTAVDIRHIPEKPKFGERKFSFDQPIVAKLFEKTIKQVAHFSNNVNDGFEFKLDSGRDPRSDEALATKDQDTIHSVVQELTESEDETLLAQS